MGCEELNEAIEHLAVIGEVGLLQHHGRSGLDHLFGVARLVVVCRGCKGNEQRRFSRGRELGYR